MPRLASLVVVAATAVLATITMAGCSPAVRVGAPCTSAARFAPFDEPPRGPDALDASQAADDAAPSGVLDALVAWYQRDGRAEALPGVGCPFAPTCSVYARTALRRHGPLAIVLIVDRLLIREHPVAAAYYPATCVAHTTRLIDDVP